MKKRTICFVLAAVIAMTLLTGCIAAETGAVVDLGVLDGPEVTLGDLLDSIVPEGDTTSPGGSGEASGGGATSEAGSPAGNGFLMPVASGVSVKSNDKAIIDYSNISDGYVMAAWLAGGSTRVKVLVKGPSGTSYQYNLNLNGTYETFPLSDGSGKYMVGVYRNTSGSSYETIVTCSFSATVDDPFGPYLRPNQYVNYSADNQAVKKAAELVSGLTGTLDKVTAVYTFVVTNITYDTEKAKSVQSGYLPNIDETLSTRKGICFDYASLMAAMLRSQGVPVQLVVGYTGSAYHAWLNVYSDTEGWIQGVIYFDGTTWKLMDPTFASSGNQSSAIMKYIGDGENYTEKYHY